MAYDSTKEERKVLLTLDKNDKGDKYQVTQIKLKGGSQEYIDIRQMYTPMGDSEPRPTQKGVRFNSEMLLDIMKSLIEAIPVDEAEDLMHTIKEAINK